jgi:hypothetical protein
MRKLLIPLGLVLSLLAPSVTSAHPERTTFFPDHRKGERPTYRSEGGRILSVCARDSRERTARAWGGTGTQTVRTRRTRLDQAEGCRFSEIQKAIDAAKSGDRIRVFPGVYTEPSARKVKFNDPKCSQQDPKYWEPTNDGHGEDGKVPTYQFHWDCKNSRNLVQILGDSPKDEDRECDQRCNLQIEGMGKRPGDVVLKADRIKRDALRVDRADGAVIKNMSFEQASFNGLDVVETNGFLIEDVIGRWNQNYGVLTFTSDNGLYDHVEGYGNGDSGIYPGSGPEGHCQRYGIEIRNSSSHDNTLGQSGTAGNGTYVHDSQWFDNGTGIVNDSFASGHPGMPQDCSKWEQNQVFSNNNNFFDEGNQEYCANTPFEDRPREHVCPQFQSPVGVGFAYYGANSNIIRDNRIWDNWRTGYRLFWVPAIIRGETPADDPGRQFDTSNENKITENVFGRSPAGKKLPNGVDVFWDEQGIDNCWEDNKGLGPDGAITSDPPILPNCDIGSKSPVSNPAKLAQEATCATWHPKDNPFPPGCTWFTTPPKPSADQGSRSGATGVPVPALPPEVQSPSLPGGGSEPTSPPPVPSPVPLPTVPGLG